MEERTQSNTRSQAEQLLNLCLLFFRMHAEREKLLNKLVLLPRVCIQAIQNA